MRTRINNQIHSLVHSHSFSTRFLPHFFALSLSSPPQTKFKNWFAETVASSAKLIPEFFFVERKTDKLQRGKGGRRRKKQCRRLNCSILFSLSFGSSDCNSKRIQFCRFRLSFSLCLLLALISSSALLAHIFLWDKEDSRALIPTGVLSLTAAAVYKTLTVEDGNQDGKVEGREREKANHSSMPNTSAVYTI